MRVLVCGGRDYADREAAFRVLDDLYRSTPHDALEIVQGGARGADALAREWCRDRCVPYINVPADWLQYGKGAGPIRNQRMVKQFAPDLVIAFPGGTGTDDMVSRAIDAGIKIMRVHEPKQSVTNRD